MTHTQGNWKVSKENSGIYIVGDSYIAQISDWSTENSSDKDTNKSLKEEAAANARLIAAAPELLEALKLLIDGIERKDEFKSYSIEDGLAKARIAIAKAEGEKNDK